MTFDIGTMVRNDLGDKLLVIPNEAGVDSLDGYTRCVWIEIPDAAEAHLVGETGVWPNELLEKI